MSGNELPVVVVSGLGRCGSSAMMGLLESGGISLYPCTEVYYETEAVLGLPQSPSFLEKAHGLAIKILDPQVFTPPMGLGYRFIWMDRNKKEQARSQRKFMEYRLKRPMPAFEGWEESLEQDRESSLSILRDRGEVLVVSFERLISDPLAVSYEVGRHLPEFSFDPHAASLYIRARSSDCAEGMAEEVKHLGET